MFDLQKIQYEQEEWLKDNKVYENLLARDGKKFYFLDGPPYANDIPHIGHLRIKIIKDLIIRFKFMQGYKVFFKPGFDTHGLPIEHAVEKKLNLKHKKDIEKLGVDKFIKLCKSNATLNKDVWLQVYKKAGILYFLKEPYITYENYYIESAWWTFKRWWEKGLVYKGYKPIHYCSHCQTALAGYEVTDSYLILKDPSIWVLFKLKEKLKGKEAYMLVWTTTPWTLVSNIALAIRADATYVLVELTDGKNIILAESRLDVLNELGYAYKLIDKIKGEELIGLSYWPLLDLPIQTELEAKKQLNPKIHTLIDSIKLLKERVASKTAAKKGMKAIEAFEDFVNLDEGTGVVHTAGGHGKTDWEISQHYGLPVESPLDDECKFNEKAGWLKGLWVKDADSKIIKYLEKQGSLLYSTYINHKYPVCWRCKTPLIVKLSEQYFVSIKPIKQKMLEEIEKIKWYPEFVKERMLNWVVNAEDWNISRQRYWGIPIPLWQCKGKDCNEIKLISSLKELQEEAKKAGKILANDFDLHFADRVKLLCEVCGNEMEKIPFIFDVWFDSSLATWASLGYPYWDDDLFEVLWPADRINEGQDQIRGWFYVLLFSGVATFGKAPYKALSMTGWVLDAKGQKMSKSLGNVIWAKNSLDAWGADLLRFYLIYDTPPYTVQNVDLENIKKEPLKFFNVLFNLFNLYKQIGPTEKLDEEIEDRWFNSKLNRLILNYTKAIENFELNMALRKLYDFVLNDFSRTYIQLVREKLENKKTLIKFAIKQVLKLLCIISPFFADWLWRKLKDETDKVSVILEKWPKPNENLINLEIEKKFELIKKIGEKALALRIQKKLNLRWPLPKLFIYTNEELIKVLIDVIEIIKRDVNVKEIEFKELKEISKDSVEVIKDLWVDLDFNLTDSLLAEGFAREIGRHVQEARKKLSLIKEKEIELELVLDKELNSLLTKYNLIPKIKEKVNASNLDLLREPSNKKFDLEKEVNIRGEIIKIRIKKCMDED